MNQPRSVELAGAVPVDILPAAHGNGALDAANQATLAGHIDRFGALDVILTPLGDHCSSIGVFVTAGVHAATLERERPDHTLPAVSL